MDFRANTATYSSGEELGRAPTEEEVRREHLARSRSVTRTHVSSEVYNVSEFDGATVIAAEEVGSFWATLPMERTLDIVDRLVPPFDRVFVEFQNMPNKLGVRSWGVVIESTRYDESRPSQEGFEGQGWELTGLLVGEWEKGEPVGPIARWVIPLDSEGRAYPSDAEGEGSFFTHKMTVGTLPQEELKNFVDTLTTLLGPALFAMSLMHCKNARSLAEARALARPARE